MKVGFVVTHPLHGSPGSIVRIRELAHSLAEQGVEVHVYSPYNVGTSWGKVILHHIPGFSEISYDLTRRILDNQISLRLLLSHPFLLNNAVNQLSKHLDETVKEDLDIIQGEQEIAAAACVRFAVKRKFRVFSSLHNIWPEELVTVGYLARDEPQFKTLINLEKEIIEGSEGVIVVSPEMKDYLINEFKTDPSKIHLVSAGGRVRAPSHLQRNTGSFKVVYTGMLAKRANPRLFFESIPLIQKQVENASFFVSNVGDELSRMKKLAKKLGVNPEYYWYPEESSFLEFLGSCDVGVVTSCDDLPRKMGPPVKLFDYMSVGLPVVANDIGAWSRMIRDEEIGLLVKSDPRELAEAVVRLHDDRVEAARMGARGRELVRKKYNWDVSAQALMRIYND